MKPKQTKSRLWKRLGAWALSLVLVAGLLPQTAFATDTSKAIQLGTSGIKDPTETTGTKGKYYYTPNSYIYFGVNESEPIKWRVLDADKTNNGTTSGMFLLSEYLLDSGVVFESARTSDDNDGQSNPNDWQHSDAQNWCSTFATNPDVFSTAEQAAFLGVVKTDSVERLYNIPWGVSSLTENDKVFFLSARELADYVGNYDAAPGLKATDTAQNAVGWWLRSPDAGSTGRYAGLVNELGVMYSWQVDEVRAARPAFNLNLNSVLFTSAAEGGKAANGMDSGLTATGDYTGSEWKLTLLDESRAFSISNAAINSSGNTIGFSYSNAKTGANEYISVVIEDKGEITHYGRILQLDGTTNGASGTASLTLPAGVTLDNDTKLYVFNEQYNGGEKDDTKLTDYASALIEVNPTVDTTAPTLSGGSAIRDSATAATVKFTSNEAGTYYYVVDSSATAPTIDTTGARTACASGENTISLTSLSGAGAKDIYIVAKDAVRNVSDVLTIQIPACTFTVTVNVDPPGGGTASADQSVAVEGDEIELTASPNEGYHFKEWQVTPDNVSIGDDNKFTMPAENVTVKAVFEAHNLTAHDYKAPTCTETGNSQYWECSVCKQLFSDAQGNTEITIADVTIPATGHTAGETWQHDNGSTHWKLCANCSAKVGEAAHVYENGVCKDCNAVQPTYAISASPETLDFGSETKGYAAAPAAKEVTITNTGNQSVTVNLPTSAKYIITAGTGFENGTTATLASGVTAAFTVQPKTGLGAGDYSETLVISGSNSTSASVELSFTVNAVYTLTVNLNGGNDGTTGGEYPADEVINIDAGSRSNYRFNGWTSSNGGTFADASSASTTFTMPAADTTITANWQYNGGGGGSSRPSTPSTPTGPATGESGGWEEIGDEIGEAQPGETIVVDMNGTTEVPAEIFEEVAGKDVTVEFDLGGGISWTVNGQDVPTGASFQSLNLGVDMGTSGISANVINNITGEYGSVQITLAHDGEFGFALTLTAPLGSDNAGHWANLYYYHEDSEALTFQTSGRIGADGNVSLRFIHASQYAIVIDDYDHGAEDLPFTDVAEGAWYYDAVSYVYAEGLMAGTSDTTFSPDITTSRAMIAVILWRLEGSPIVEEYTDFSDVADGAWYTEGIRWASNAGVVMGYPDGIFRPSDPITREQLAAMLYRYAVYQGMESVTLEENLAGFTDADKINGYAIQAMNWAVGQGIMGGYGDNTLRPQGNATRAQAAAMLQRFCEKFGE